ncbi:Putative VPS9 domain, ankyrin repeat-containing domain superfamily, PX domain superfamily [Septoria linicola]|uniref:VPS9 domain, ankyrin repeat-containing domain superfamily, PX domain superfamily n=1 Tax=Septoria linicola TaxID=215465 RepID=A0A9Q9EED6_9PEZI|nr:Putative VPS9 domain, ankyrin repeat-containing domain superfamily, PX domain superfamily [Septoria linicola]
MHPLNPYVRAFFRSALPAQCQPIAHHILLVPTTEVLLRAKDRDSNTPYVDLAGTEEFLASHVLRVPGGGPSLSGGSSGGGSARESKNKAKQYTTINGRTVVIKDSFVYSNKGFKTLNQAQLLGDAIYYPDAADGQQWLVYYISRPLIGTYQPTPIIPAVISDAPSVERKKVLAEASGDSGTSNFTSGPPLPKKKDIKGFGDLLIQFPMISRQMQSGLERIIREFIAANDTPLQRPKSLSRSSSFSSQASRPSISDSVSSLRSSVSGTSTVHPTFIELEPEEETLRTALETAIVAAIDLFQNVDKQQLSILGASTELTGPAVERMIERYVTEQVHDQNLFPRVCAIRRPDDSDLESKVRKMADVDIAQVGIPVDDGMKGKRALAARLNNGIQIFRKMGVASSPEEMLDILLDTQKAITKSEEGSAPEATTPLTINADILVSMLLVVVIRSGVRHLHSRLLYMRYFIFIDEVEAGEQGYALATLEAVLAHLSGTSTALRKASKKNRLLWQAVKTGDVKALAASLQVEDIIDDSAAVADSPTLMSSLSSDDEDETIDTSLDDDASPQRPTRDGTIVDFAAVNGSLQHVFPFQRPPTPPPELPQRKTKKHVSMASLPRSHSASSAYSSRSHSRQKSVESDFGSNSGGDLSGDKLAQTQDTDGNSVLMMAVEAGKHDALRFLLRLPAHFRADFVLEDVNNDGATLLSAAVQSGNRDTTDVLIDHLEAQASEEELMHYLELQDNKGRCFAHYLFHQPHLIKRFGKKLPWRLKDKNGQTPLFALCRSYDHEQYHDMVEEAIKVATDVQGDGEPLHLDDHVDAKGNTLLHVMNDTRLTLRLLRYCDSDVNAANDKRFTPLMVASKYGRIDLVRALFGDPRVDMTMKDLRGLTAVELAKDDDVRNRIDDLTLLSMPPGRDGRTTTVVRSFFVEDSTVRLVLKSGAPNASGLVTVTTCRRSIADFENLSKWLAIECPASWVPTQFLLSSPFLVPSKPSRAVLRDIQLRMDHFFRNLLAHGTFSTHELVWEFFLVPELDPGMLLERSKRKAEARVDNVKDDFEPITDTHEVENFVEHAREQIKGVTSATKKTIRETNKHRMLLTDVHDAQQLASSALSTINFLPERHLTAMTRYAKVLAPSEANPFTSFYYSLHASYSSSTAIQYATNRPAYLIGSMQQAQRTIDRSKNSVARSNRWTPKIGGLFEDAKKAVAMEAWEKAAKARGELETLGCELRYTQQTIASELAVWQDEHVKMGREALRRLARECVVKERAKLEGMKRALRCARGG